MKNGHFWNLKFEFFFLQTWKTQFSKQIVIYVIAFDPIKIQTCLAPHSDCQHLIPAKDTYVDAKKWPQKVLNGHFSNLNFQIFFFQNWKTQFWKQIVIYVVAFDPIKI